MTSFTRITSGAQKLRTLGASSIGTDGRGSKRHAFTVWAAGVDGVWILIGDFSATSPIKAIQQCVSRMHHALPYTQFKSERAS